eukprot:TRINITY_DN2290_c1_g1_i1.p1 TRINITY_DN2290_c1_g1~~TRINITY_DN2290_c1_g1_i1.p1  ORF type:complete len:332 (-),score=41.95 TRINITY_DN2290_c1_g1_i1:67-1035(-)
MAHPYALAQQYVPQILEGGFAKGNGKGKDKDDQSNDWHCPACGDRNFSRRVTCRKCDTPNPSAKLPDVNDIGFKTIMCSFFEAGRCTKGAYCTFAHGEEEKALGRQMQESKADAMPGLELSQAPLEVQQFLGGLPIKQLPIKQFLAMEPWQQNLVMQRGQLRDSRDPTAVLISRMVTVRKMAKIQQNGGFQAAMPQATAALTFQAPMNAIAGGQSAPSGPVYQVVFQPGPIGVGADWSTGRVDRIVTGGQGAANGVVVGDWFTKINEIDYNEQLLDATIALGQPFAVTFTRSQEAAASLEGDLSQLAANLGMQWAFDGAALA